jgi:hypothetical protein
MRLRHRIGEPTALAALHRYLRRRDACPADLLKIAAALRVYGPVLRAVDVASAVWAGPRGHPKPGVPTLTCKTAPGQTRTEQRGTQQLLTLYVVERWLARLSASPHADKFVIKGGMLLAAYEARRPTADLDALARWVANDQNVVVALVSDIACLVLNDGVE